MQDEPEIIKVPDALRNKVWRGARRVDPAAVERAERAVAGLQADYVGWAQADLCTLRAAFERTLAASPGERPEAVLTLFAAAHELRGQGGSFGYPLVTELGGRLCRLLEDVPTLDDAAFAAIRRHVDALEAVLTHRLTGDGGAEGQALLQRLEM